MLDVWLLSPPPGLGGNLSLEKKSLVWSQGQQVALRCEGGDGLTEIAGVTGATGDGDDGDDGADRRHWRDGRLG